MSAATAMPFWHLSVAEWLAKINDLSLEERGGLFTLLLTSWDKGHPLVNDARRISRMLGCTRHKWRKRILPGLVDLIEPLPPEDDPDAENGLLVFPLLERDRARARASTKSDPEKPRKYERKSPQNLPKNDENSGSICDESSPYARDAIIRTTESGDSDNAIPANPESDSEISLERNGDFKKFARLDSGNSESGDRYNQETRDTIGSTMLHDVLGLEWGTIMAADTLDDPNHAASVAIVLRALKQHRAAGGRPAIGWVTPEKRQARAGYVNGSAAEGASP